tara:strand:+ start:4785 stop:5228 length:444 start_codon:yes stop_codon:yes gene_type:complete
MLKHLCAALALALPSTGQSDVITAPGNILYGSSCDKEIAFWLSSPKRGEDVDMILDIGDSAPPLAVAWVAIGFTKDNTLIGVSRGIPCYLLAWPHFVVPVVLFNGLASRPLFRVPSDPALKGLPLYAQALSDAVELTMSRGAEMQVR